MDGRWSVEMFKKCTFVPQVREVEKEDGVEVPAIEVPAPLAIKATGEPSPATIEFIPGEEAEAPQPRTTSVYTSMTKKLKDDTPKKSDAMVRVTDEKEDKEGFKVAIFLPSFFRCIN